MHNPANEIVTYRGAYLETMSREELIEAVRDLGRELHKHYTPEASEARALGRIEQLKSGKA